MAEFTHQHVYRRTKYCVVWTLAHLNWPITGKAGCIWVRMELEQEWHMYSLNPFVSTLSNEKNMQWFYEVLEFYWLKGFMRDSVFKRYVLVPKDEHEEYRTRWTN